METGRGTSFLLLVCLFQTTLQQVRENDDIHHNLNGPDGGNAKVYVEEAPDGRPDCPQQRLDGRAEAQHRACEPRTKINWLNMNMLCVF